ncbi:MAG: MerR family transcriptional regulator [Candidatus Gastranaerophilales bacterium]|nr:MerR family transcriptional regulator [Candidatus Gastranaerophilales bacterium]
MAKESLKYRQSEFDGDKPVFPISVVADILQVHQRTLRIYNEENILVPARSPKNRRLYSLNDIELGKFVQYLSRRLGINIIGIKIILELLKDKKISPANYRESIDAIAKRLNITEEIQEQNNEKLSRRGRKPSSVSM